MKQFNSPAFMSSVNIENKWFVVKELQRVTDVMALADFGNDFSSFSAVAKRRWPCLWPMPRYAAVDYMVLILPHDDLCQLCKVKSNGRKT